MSLLLLLAPVMYVRPLHIVEMPRSARSASAMVRMGVFDGWMRTAAEAFREVKVQHILVSSQSEANEIHDEICAEGVSAEVFGRFAATRSTCGSAKKRPDAKLAMLRGAPGELKFRRGSMAKPFEVCSHQ